MGRVFIRAEDRTLASNQVEDFLRYQELTGIPDNGRGGQIRISRNPLLKYG
jgi:hypothetical protein